MPRHSPEALARNSEQVRKAALQRLYGISPEQFDEMLSRQNGVCAICGKPCNSGTRLSVDHDHQTGRVRGLLCRRCNRAIGLLDDDPQTLREAARYLEDS